MVQLVFGFIRSFLCSLINFQKSNIHKNVFLKSASLQKKSFFFFFYMCSLSHNKRICLKDASGRNLTYFYSGQVIWNYVTRSNSHKKPLGLNESLRCSEWTHILLPVTLYLPPAALSALPASTVPRPRFSLWAISAAAKYGSVGERLKNGDMLWLIEGAALWVSQAETIKACGAFRVFSPPSNGDEVN